MVTPEMIRELDTPGELSVLLDGFDKILEIHARYHGVGHTEYECYKRFVDDYKTSISDPNYPYYFDSTEAEDIITIANMFKYYDSGKLSNFVLCQFQRFIILNLYGWYRKSDNTLRFREGFIGLGRRNGKSMLCGILGEYYTIFSGFKSAKGYIISLTKDHSKVVFDNMMTFFDADPDLAELCFIDRSDAVLRCKGTQNTLQAFSGAKNKDGFTSNFAISDEQNATDGKLPQLIIDGQADQRQALFIGISTAYFEINGWGHKKYKMWKKQMASNSIPDTVFLYICEPDEAPSDDLHYYEQPWTWLQANPYILWNRDGTPNADKLERYKTAMETAFSLGGDSLVSFVTKQCNTWCANKEVEFCSYRQLEANARDYTFEEVCKEYKEWFLGIDLASTRDNNSVTWGAWIWEDDNGTLLGPEDYDGKKRLYFHTIQFMPADLLDEHIKSDKFNYRLYVDKELMLVEGKIMNFKAIYDYIERIGIENEISYKTIAADPYNISSIQTNLEGICEFFVKQAQTSKALSEYIEQLQARINVGDVVYTKGKEDLFKRAVLQSRVSRDANKYYFIEKASGDHTSNMRIDSVDSLLDMAIAPLIEENRDSVNGDAAIDEWESLF